MLSLRSEPLEDCLLPLLMFNLLCHRLEAGLPFSRQPRALGSCCHGWELQVGKAGARHSCRLRGQQGRCQAQLQAVRSARQVPGTAARPGCRQRSCQAKFGAGLVRQSAVSAGKASQPVNVTSTKQLNNQLPHDSVPGHSAAWQPAAVSHFLPAQQPAALDSPEHGLPSKHHRHVSCLSRPPMPASCHAFGGQSLSAGQTPQHPSAPP